VSIAAPPEHWTAGTIDEMRAKYGKSGEAVGFTFDEKLKPSIIFKPKLTDMNIVDF